MILYQLIQAISGSTQHSQKDSWSMEPSYKKRQMKEIDCKSWEKALGKSTKSLTLKNRCCTGSSNWRTKSSEWNLMTLMINYSFLKNSVSPCQSKAIVISKLMNQTLSLRQRTKLISSKYLSRFCSMILNQPLSQIWSLPHWKLSRKSRTRLKYWMKNF